MEMVQPTRLVCTRLLTVAKRYTTENVRVVALPTILLIQVGTASTKSTPSARSTTQLDLARRVDSIARMAVAGAITPGDAIRGDTGDRGDIGYRRGGDLIDHVGDAGQLERVNTISFRRSRTVNAG